MKNKPDSKIEYYPLTHAQKRIYYDHMKFPGPWANIGFCIKYSTIIDLELIKKAINIVLQRNDAFRLRIVERDFGPLQYIAPFKPITIDDLDFIGPECENRLNEWCEKTTQIQSDIVDKDLYYFVCLKLNDNKSGYYFRMHHTICDGWTSTLLIKEIHEIYKALKSDENNFVSPNPSYLKYIEDEQKYLNSEEFQKDKKYWLKSLLPLPEKIILSTKHNATTNIDAEALVLPFPDYIGSQIHSYCKTYKTSLYKLMFSTLSVYLSRITGNNDFSIGGTNHNRTREIYKDMAGMFVSTIPFRVAVDDKMTFKLFVENNGRNINYILKNHQKYPFDLLATEIKEIFNTDAGSLVDLFLIGHSGVKTDEFIYNYIFPHSIPNSLTIHLNISTAHADTVALEYNYQVEMFSESDIKRIHQGLGNILANALGDPSQKISDIELLSPEEKQKVIYDFNNTKAEFQKDVTIYQLFQDQVEKTPENIALIFRKKQLTYREFNEKANQLARVLRDKGVKPDAIVALMLDRSLEMMIGIFAIIKAGGAYLPIETNYPSERLRYLLEASGTEIILTRPETADKIDDGYLLINPDDENYYKGDGGNLETVNKSTDLVYIIFTSGSTGKPKGVMLEHRSVVNYITWAAKTYVRGDILSFPLYTSITFDLTVTSVFTPLTTGNTIVIYGEENKLVLLEQIVEENRVGVVKLTPAHFKVLKEQSNQVPYNIKRFILGGEALESGLSAEIHKLFHGDIEIYNEYGPTEATVGCMIYQFDPETDKDKYVPIGKPADNARIYILGKKMNPLPIGIAGEMFIAGDCVARGYLKRPDLTEERFLKDPFFKNDRMYRTGDLARWLPDGNMDFLGRIDFQVKIRGFRIEIGEIENQIKQYPGINDAVVIAKGSGEDTHLCSFIVSNEKIDVAMLETLLSKSLMDYMIPSHFVQIEKIPITPNGKVDSKALAKIDVNYTQMPYIHKKTLAEYARFTLKIIKETDLFEERILGEDPAIIARMEDPSKGKFSCFIIGDSTAIIRCAEIVLQNGHRLYGMISNNQEVTDWAKKKDIIIIRARPEYVSAFLELKPFNYLFSIDNTMTMREDILALPKECILNCHHSLLPKHSGFNPVNWAIMNMEKKHGVTWHVVGSGIFLGDIVKQVEIYIEPQDTADTLNTKCTNSCLSSFEEIIASLEGGPLPRHKQNTEGLTYFERFKRLNSGGLVSFNRDADEISAFVRGLSVNGHDNPIGLPRFCIDEVFYVIPEVSVLTNVSEIPPGTVVKITSGSITMTTTTKDIKIRKLLFVNGGEITISDFTEKHNLYEGYQFEEVNRERALRIEKLDSKICRFEHFWIERLKHLQPVILTSTIPGELEEEKNDFSSKKFYIPVDVKTHDDQFTRGELVLAAFTSFLALITGISTFDIGYSDTLLRNKIKDLEGLFTGHIPFHVNLASNQNFKEFLRNIYEELKTVKKCKTYIRDIRIRYRDLQIKPAESIPVGVIFVKNLNDFEMPVTRSSQLDLVIPEDGNACIVLYNNSLINENSVIQFFLQFLDYTHEVFSDCGLQISGKILEDIGVKGRIERHFLINNSVIDIGEVEICLKAHKDITDAAVVLNKSKSGKQSLCSFVVSEKAVNESSIREYLSEKLPQYKIAGHLIQLDEMPLTQEGIADRKLLEIAELKIGASYEAPRDETEDKLAEIFHEVLRMEKNKISINESFFKLGGHSLKAAILITKIHKELNIRISLSKIFDLPSIKQLAAFIKEADEDKFVSIEKTDSKEYYPQTSPQKRLYFMDQLEKNSTVYNMPLMDIYHLGTEKEKLEYAFKKLIERHESLRTSFHTINGKAVQKVHNFQEIEFNVEYYETQEDGMIYSEQVGMEWTQHTGVPFQDVVEYFVQPFNLKKPPLIRAGLINIAGAIQILMVDMHHIVSDGISMLILKDELWELYGGKKLPPLKIQYKDYAEWCNKEEQQNEIKKQEKYWLKEFVGEIPLINLPTDFQRPAKPTFDGDLVKFEVGDEETRKLNIIAKNHSYTFYMVLLSIFNILLTKLSGQEEIIIGTVTAGRGHADLQPLIGMFVDTLAIRNFPEKNKTVEEFLIEVKGRTLSAFENQDYPLEELVSKISTRQDPSRNPLFDVLFVLENEDDRSEFLLEVLMLDKSNPFSYEIRKAKFDLSLYCVETNKGMECSIEYKTRLFKQETIERIAGYFKKIVTSVCSDLKQKIEDIQIISEKEKKQILYEYNDTKSEYPKDKTIYQMFQDQEQKTPDNIAVIFYENRITYKVLNEKSNQLARVLRKKGVESDTIAAIMIERSMEMMIGIFAILKAGGAYLPIEPSYPRQRIEYILNDSQAKVLLILGKFENIISSTNFSGTVINLECPELYSSENENLPIVNKANNMAYIIYTSGSTGRPKGVIIEHQSLITRLTWMQSRYPIGSKDVILQKTTYVFDVSVWELFWWSWYGAAQCLLIPGGEKEPAAIIEAIEKHNISTMHFVPSMLSGFLVYLEGTNALTTRVNLKQVFASGEALTIYQAEKFNQLVYQRTKKTRLINLYGPTEATVDVSYFECPSNDKPDRIPIGKPVHNTHLLVVNNKIGLQPIGIEGELCISGDQLARGYLNRPELTQEIFIDNPYAGENDCDPMYKRLYRTGDLCHWLPDGNIEYLGRIDFQVKVRGFRIELGEIENELMAIDEIKEAVVIAKDDGKGEKYLCAYFVSKSQIEISTIRDTLSMNMPYYMVPSYIIPIKMIPITSNGKLDRRMLPEPEIETIPSKYTSPTKPNEILLAGIWSQVLGREQVGVDDNFFEIGGDSIKAILIISQLQKNGFKLDVAQMFLHKTVKKLCKFMMPIDIKKAWSSNQETITGKTKLTPIQKWFFETGKDRLPHFNQFLTLSTDRENGFNKDVIIKIFSKILMHHDALRMSYKLISEERRSFIQENRHYNENNDNMFYLGGHPTHDEILKEGFHLDKGPLVKLGLYSEDGSTKNRLLILIHHLVIDGVSWRILLEDFESGYKQALEENEIKFPDKSDSFQYWANELANYSESSDLLREIPFWQKIENTKIDELPVDNRINSENQTFKNVGIYPLELSEFQTNKLLTGINHAYNTEINDILLSALTRAVKIWTGIDKILVELEGHGREDIGRNIDISRTIGWFTTKYPVVFDLAKIDDIPYTIINVKETLRRIPNKGIGYGVLRYLTNETKRKGLSFKKTPDILFNYLGVYNQKESKLISNISGLTELQTSEWISPDLQLEHKIDVEGVVSDNKLKFNIFYSTNEYFEETIEKFACILKDSLENIINHCAAQKINRITPSDLGYKKLSIQDLEEITHYIKDTVDQDLEIKAIYPLSPMQAGMLYHCLKDKDTNAYFDLISVKLQGKVNESLFRESLSYILNKYDALRTVFAYKNLDEAVQLILTKRKIKFYYEDLSLLNETEQSRLLSEKRIQDQNKGFNLSKDLLVKFSLFKTAPDSFLFNITFHHIIMDGWCLGILIKELKQIYRKLETNQSLNQEPEAPYRDYINWLDKQNKAEGLRFWEHYLDGYEEQASLPKSVRNVGHGDFKLEQYDFILNEKLSKDITNLSSRHQVTLNVVFQTVWGILLKKYNNTDDVVFGAVVSGRPGEIQNVDTMVGLFINMIPVRIKSTPDQLFSQLVNNVQKESTTSKIYEYLPVAEIQAKSALKGELIDHIMVFESYPIDDELKDPSKGFTMVSMEGLEQTNYDFDIAIAPLDQIHIVLSYNSLVYDRVLMKNISKHMEKVFRQIIDTPDIAIKNIEIVTVEEKQLLIENFNKTDTPYPQNKTFHQLFEEQAERTPDNIAVKGRCYSLMGTPDTSLTYRQLNREANRLAQIIRDKGVKPDSIVGIITEPSIEMFTAMFSVMKAGGAYVPIDPTHPQDRIDFILEDSETRVLLLTKDMENRVEFQGEKVYLENESSDKQTFANPRNKNTPDNLIYVIYTSGTTGKPKGVMTEHGNVVAYLYAFYDEFDIKTGDSVIQQASYTFDVFVEEVYPVLMRGGIVSIPGRDKIMDIDLLIDYIACHSINIIDCTPLLLNEINKAVLHKPGALDSMHTFISGGDVLKPSYVDNLVKIGTVYNTYGPTETTVCVTYQKYEGNTDFSSIPIGKPISNYKAYILDEHLKLQPLGFGGELCVSGKGVSRGYLKRPELTAEKFIDNPYVPGERLYRTGDLVRWLPDGTIDFMGRIDHQVKIRGYRIELGEIEAALTKHPNISDTVILAINTPTGIGLCAYYVSSTEIPVTDIKAFLSVDLPNYMIPAYFVQMESIPLTSNLKVDRKALPDPTTHVTGTIYEAPRNSMEMLMTDIWQNVLGIEQVGIDDDFFDLGGDSIKSMHIVSRFRKNGLNVDIKFLFIHSTIRKLAKHIDTVVAAEMAEQVETVVQIGYEEIPECIRKETEEEVKKRLGESIEITSMCTLTPHQKEVLLSTMANKESYYVHNLIDIPVWIDIAKLETAFNKMIERFEVCRTIYTVPKSYEPLQIILKQRELKIEFEDISHLYDDKKQAAFKNIRAADKKRGFDLTVDSPMRVILVKTGESNNKLIWVVHNIIFDTFGSLIMVEELIRSYDALVEKKPVLLEPEIPFSTFVRWLRQQDNTEGWRYWREYLDGCPQSPTLSNYGKVVEKNLYELREYFFTIEEIMTDHLRNLAVTNRVTLNTLFQTIWGVLLQKYTGSDDVLIGSVVSGRSAPMKGIDRIVGLFLNTIPIRINAKEIQIFSQLLHETQLKSLQLKTYEHLPLYEDPQSPLNKESIDHLMFFQNIQAGEGEEPNVMKSRKDDGLYFKFLGNIEQLDHNFNWYIVPNRPILIRFGYNALAYKDEFVKQIEINLKSIAQQVIDNPNIEVKDIKINIGKQ